MNKVISRTLSVLLAAAMIAGMSVSAFAEMHADVAGPSGHKLNDGMHYANGSEIGTPSKDQTEIDSLTPYFKSLKMTADQISNTSCGGIINMKIGETIRLHKAQTLYGMDGKTRNAFAKFPDGIIETSGSENLVEIKGKGGIFETYCTELNITAKANGTIILVSLKGQYFFEYYKIVIGSGENDTSINADTAKDENAPAKETKPATPAAKPATPAPSTIGVIHTVKAGDTFAKLALNYYGDMSVWPQLYAANAAAIEKTSNYQMYVGMELTIPGTIGNGVISPAFAGEGEVLYTVKAGDTYGTIALARFGTMARYREIFNRNTDRLKDIKTLIEGQILVLPQK